MINYIHIFIYKCKNSLFESIILHLYDFFLNFANKTIYKNK